MACWLHSGGQTARPPCRNLKPGATRVQGRYVGHWVSVPGIDEDTQGTWTEPWTGPAVTASPNQAALQDWSSPSTLRFGKPLKSKIEIRRHSVHYTTTYFCTRSQHRIKQPKKPKRAKAPSPPSMSCWHGMGWLLHNQASQDFVTCQF